MMKLYNLGSSSKGNCYIFEYYEKDTDYTQSIMVECGLPKSQIVKRATEQNIDLSKVKTCLITHGHSDHCIGLKDLGILRHICGSERLFTYESIKNRSIVLKSGKESVIDNNLRVLPFNVEHDWEDSLGFVIYNSRTGDTVLFINDCKYVKYDLSNFDFDYVFIECNYIDSRVRGIYAASKKRLDEGVGNQEDKDVINEYGRVINSHMSLYGCIRTLKKLNLDRNRCKGIFLMHLSERHSNGHEMKIEVSNQFLIPTYICRKNGGMM